MQKNNKGILVKIMYESDSIDFEEESYTNKNNIKFENYRSMTLTDNKLTEEEKTLLENNGFKLFCCLCCDNTNEISKIINRNVYACGICYCCMGDDPLGNICDVYVNDNDRSIILMANKEDLNKLDEFNKKYYGQK